MSDDAALAKRFEEHRGHLRAVAYRILGSLPEADDAVLPGIVLPGLVDGHLHGAIGFDFGSCTVVTTAPPPPAAAGRLVRR